MRFLIDTNVLARLSHVGHAHQGFARNAIQTLRDDGHELRTVPQVLYEYWSVVTRPVEQNGLGFDAGPAYLQLQELQTLFPTLRDERGVLRSWQELVHREQVRGRQSHDARLVAAMMRHGLTHLLTFNGSDFRRYSGIEIVDPHDVSPSRTAS
jgi:predicted nucleic acid-binding protein